MCRFWVGPLLRARALSKTQALVHAWVNSTLARRARLILPPGSVSPFYYQLPAGPEISLLAGFPRAGAVPSRRCPAIAACGTRGLRTVRGLLSGGYPSSPPPCEEVGEGAASLARWPERRRRSVGPTSPASALLCPARGLLVSPGLGLAPSPFVIPSGLAPPSPNGVLSGPGRLSLPGPGLAGASPRALGC